ncbi:hypothetical protein N7449_004357 [Penicillium cf. viridicatum]|uniref:Uncharacterized protein n=1 Tax=Penicillium cf. viridicatum TaxID=2972119 RepID=A0A9W9SXV8_9EURO|nr:hypothetical protein N7449_009299 [Penicillium cf. viridicatum]KAJ5202278.1 hypothetical protein N7449_004357 [Penicillium cf. viridicatum]
MAPPRPISSREAVESRLPELLLGPNRTQSSAMHRVIYVGPLHRWQNFEANVRASMPARWSSAVIDYSLQSRDIRREEVYIADETGLQGRFEQAVGQVLGAVFRAEAVNIRFADFKAAGTGYSKTPDVSLVSNTAPIALKAVGELKVPWVDDHDLVQRYSKESTWRSTIGQVVEYMIDQKVPYGFHSTYYHTVFLRQVQVHGVWRVECSPIVNNRNTGVSVKQCFWHLASLAAAGQPVQNPTPKRQLIVRG